MLDLVIHDLIERTAFVEKSVEFDDVCILGRESDKPVRCNWMAGVKVYRGAVFVGGPVETKNNHPRLAYGRVSRHGGYGQRKRRRRSNL